MGNYYQLEVVYSVFFGLVIISLILFSVVDSVYISYLFGNWLWFLGGLDFMYSDFNSFIIIMLMFCSVISLIYCLHYFGGLADSYNLFYLMFFFVLVMLALSMTAGYFASLVFWEYLGFVSYVLVIFYNSGSSSRGASITLVSSRFGDLGLFILTSLYLCGGGGFTLLFIVSFYLVVISKSAGFPLTSWLLEAMRAPTPVSALVHSSTLVASGVWFMMCYSVGGGIIYSSFFVWLLLTSCVFTIYLSGICAVFNQDVKQVVALSTCNNISWVLLMNVLGSGDLALYQLVVHGLSKCLLFSIVGDYISSSGGGQFSNQVLVGVFKNRGNLLYMSVLLMGLCGVPFLGVFFIKHLFLGFLFNYGIVNWLLCVVLFLGFSVSCMYCLRLYMLFFKVDQLSVGGVTSRFYLVWFLFFFISYLSFYVSYGVVVSDSGMFSLLVMILMVFGALCGYAFSSISMVNLKYLGWVHSLWGSDVLVRLFEYIIVSFGSVRLVGVFRWELWFLEYLGLCNIKFSSSYLIPSVVFFGGLLTFFVLFI